MNFDRIRHQHLQKPSELESGRSKYPECELVVPLWTAIMPARDLRHLAVEERAKKRLCARHHHRTNQLVRRHQHADGIFVRGLVGDASRSRRGELYSATRQEPWQVARQHWEN